MKTIRYSPTHSRFEGVILVDKIVHLYKMNDEVTLITLITGETLSSSDSVNTLEARIKLS